MVLNMGNAYSGHSDADAYHDDMGHLMLQVRSLSAPWALPVRSLSAPCPLPGRSLSAGAEAPLPRRRRQLEQFARRPGKTALFRETGAQHFNSEGAFSTWEESHPPLSKGCTCSPLKDVTELSEARAGLGRPRCQRACPVSPRALSAG